MKRFNRNAILLKIQNDASLGLITLLLSYFFRVDLLNEVSMFTLNPATAGVYRRYPEAPFNASSLGNPYPYGMDPVCCIYCRVVLLSNNNNLF